MAIPFTVSVSGQPSRSLSRLRACPDTAHIKVVLVTARAQDADPARDTHVYADAYLIKPFDVAELIRVVRNLAADGARSSA